MTLRILYPGAESQDIGRLLKGIQEDMTCRVGLEIALGYRPLEEGVQAPVAVVSGRGLPAGELVGDEGLDVCALELAGDERMAVSLAVGGEQPDGVGVGLDGPGALVLASRVRRKLRLRARRWPRGS
jgi:hypothetical protein